jgi:mRNA interferase RelE/StbE
VKRDLKRLDKQTVKKILDEIENELVSDPAQGKELSGEFAGLLSYRMGNYRVIYSIIRDSVLVLRIGHRKEVYRRKIT